MSTVRPSVGQFLGFVLAGGVATILNYSLFLILYESGVYYSLASAVGYVSGIALSFAINLRFVFRTRQPRSGLFGRYTVAYLIALIAQVGLLEVLVRSGFPAEIANALAIAIVLLANFLVIRRWVFRSGRGHASP